LPDTSDEDTKAPGVLVNATMARTFWPHQSAIGRRVRPGGPETPWCRVVGVVADIKNAGVDKAVGTELFYPYKLYAPSNFVVIIKAQGDPLRLTASVRTVVASIDSTLPLAKIRTMDDVLAASTSRPRFLSLILGMFSFLALGLATVGVYGVIAYSVEQRTAEFGIKIALGAEPARLLRQVIGQGLILGLLGVAVGVSCTLLLTQFLEGMLFGVSKSDPASLLLTCCVLALATVCASLVPALKATRIEPIRALRCE
jgi:ABC-type antimicrobial peptide transport system permease subunit